MKPSFRIREANPEDLVAILHLINSQANTGKILRRTRKEVGKVMRSFFVAEAGKTIIGCCALEIYNQKLAEIRSLAVEPKFRRKGVATALLERCIETAKRKDVYEILAITDREAVFSPHGFSQVLHGQKALFLRP